MQNWQSPRQFRQAGTGHAGYASRYTAEFPEFAVTHILVLWLNPEFGKCKHCGFRVVGCLLGEGSQNDY
jgi:hypothetical protein